VVSFKPRLFNLGGTAPGIDWGSKKQKEILFHYRVEWYRLF